MNTEELCSSVVTSVNSIEADESEKDEAYVELGEAEAVGMLMLPEEVVGMITKLLTPQELATCCAVSVGWRELFKRSVFWRRDCDKTLAEYLRIAEPCVKSKCVIPEQSDSNLSPMSDWRSNCIREVRLWTNWRKGKYKSEDINSIPDKNSRFIPWTFFKNDYFLVLYKHKIEVWDIRSSPVIYVENPCNLLPQFGVDFLEIFGDKIVIVQCFVVLVFRVDLTLRNWPLDRGFIFNKDEKLIFSKSKYMKGAVNPDTFGEVEYEMPLCAIIGDLFLGCDDKTMCLHIWNLKTITKIKEKRCGSVWSSKFSHIKPSRTSDDMVVIVLTEDIDDRNYALFLVYSLSSFEFYHSATMYNNMRDFLLVDNYLAVATDNRLAIYNYHTFEEVKIVENSGDSDYSLIPGYSEINITVYDNHIVYNQGNTLKMFLSPTEEKTLLEIDERIIGHTLVCNRFFFIEIFMVVKHWSHCTYPGKEYLTATWEVGDKFKRIRSFSMDPMSKWGTNKACTRLVEVPKNGIIRLYNYW
uniref:F-box domain-containing protein n=1 Tax=Graphocephala atropunctata TaxID=36148 RepID=A0A1B6KJ15_9HEMI